MNKITTKLIAGCAIILSTNTSFSHDGHGLTGNHWHITDAWGFIGLAAAVAVAAWLSRGGK
jgi:hypothetical protein